MILEVVTGVEVEEVGNGSLSGAQEDANGSKSNDEEVNDNN